VSAWQEAQTLKARNATMKRRTVVSGLASIAAVAWLGMAMPVHAEDDFVYGRELMTQQEMTEHRAHMRSLNTEQEREAYRLEHHKLMQERAREQGKTLPDEPRSGGQGMGGGMGPGGGGMGPGGGMGSGGGGMGRP